MNARLSLASSQLSPEDLQSLTRDLCRAVNRETDVEAELATTAAAPGTRGDAMAIGGVILTLVTSGTAAALVNLCKSYFDRESSIELTFERADGQKLTIKQKNVDSTEVAKTLGTVRDFFGDPV